MAGHQVEDSHAELKFEPASPDGADFMAVFERRKEITQKLGIDEALRDREWLRLHAVISGNEIGSCRTQGEARLAIDFLDDPSFLENQPETAGEILTAGGFRISPNPYVTEERIWVHPSASGYFQVYENEDSMWLLYQPERASRWHNIFYLMTSLELQDGSMQPLFWPEHVTSPMRAAAALAVHMTRLRLEQRRPSRPHA